MKYSVSGSSSCGSLFFTAVDRISSNTRWMLVFATSLKDLQYCTFSTRSLPLISTSCGFREKVMKWLWNSPLQCSAKYMPRDSATVAGIGVP